MTSVPEPAQLLVETLAMKAKLKTGEIVTLEKECECICHNDPHWVYMDRLDRARNRKILESGTFLGAIGFAQEDLIRVREKLRQMESLGIVELIAEPADEFTELQQRRYEAHTRSLYPELFREPEQRPDLNDVRVAAKRRF
jgi:hypothetical protein